MPFSPETRRAHRARWFVWAWDGKGHVERLPHRADMRGTWGWDVECACGWQSRTGGATRLSVLHDLWFHRWQAEQDAQEGGSQ
jgi:hypothetical protein